MSFRRVPYRGEIWQADLDPTVGHEQAGTRPVVVVSADPLHESASRLVIVVPVTRRDRGNPFDVEILPQIHGLRYRGFALCEMVRSISMDRLRYRIGSVERFVLEDIGDRLRVLFELQ